MNEDFKKSVKRHLEDALKAFEEGDFHLVHYHLAHVAHDLGILSNDPNIRYAMSFASGAHFDAMERY